MFFSLFFSCVTFLMVNFKILSVFKCVTLRDLHFKSMCQYELKWRTGLKANHRIRLSVNFHFCHTVGNYSCTPSSSFSHTVCSVCVCKYVYERKRLEEAGENRPYILLQSRCPYLKTFQRQFKGNVNLSLLNLTHTHTPTKRRKKTHLPSLPYTHIMH